MSNFIFTYNEFLGKWANYFLTNSIEILFLAIPATIFSLLFRKKSPRFHYFLWTIVLIKTLIPSNIVNIKVPQIYTIEFPAIITTTFTQTIEPKLNLYQNLFFIFWMGIASFLLIKLIINSIAFRKILKSKTEINNDFIKKIQTHYNIGKNIHLFEANINIPFTIGIFEPKIFLPKNSDFTKIEFILAHELAHIKRNDFLIILIQNIITIAFFFHPIVLIASGFLNYYREIICDDMAVEAINSSPKNYGRKIIDYLEFCLKQKKYPVLANGFIFSKKIIIKRIEYLINRKENVKQNLSKFQILLIFSLVTVMIYIVACESITKVEKPLINNQSQVKFIPYDQAPDPIGGFAAIQKNVIYPKKDQEAGIEGTIIIQAFVDENGDVSSTNVLKGVPNSGLDEAAISAIKLTKFKPAKQGTKDIGVWISIPVVFKLKILSTELLNAKKIKELKEKQSLITKQITEQNHKNEVLNNQIKEAKRKQKYYSKKIEQNSIN